MPIVTIFSRIEIDQFYSTVTRQWHRTTTRYVMHIRYKTTILQPVRKKKSRKFNISSTYQSLLHAICHKCEIRNTSICLLNAHIKKRVRHSPACWTRFSLFLSSFFLSFQFAKEFLFQSLWFDSSAKIESYKDEQMKYCAWFNVQRTFGQRIFTVR